MIIDWIDSRTCSSVEIFGSQFSVATPCHVPSSERHTFPSLYKFGLNRTCPFPVVARFTFGEVFG